MAKHQYLVEMRNPGLGPNEVHQVEADGFEAEDGYTHFLIEGERAHSFSHGHLLRVERQASAVAE